MNKLNEKIKVLSDDYFKSPLKMCKNIARDGFYNDTLRLGQSENNGGAYAQYRSYFMGPNELRVMYRGHGLIRKIIDIMAEDITRDGVQVNLKDPNEIKEFQAAWSRLRITESLTDLVKNGRLFGGAIAVMAIKGHVLSTPLNIDRISKDQFEGLVVYDRWYTTNYTFGIDAITRQPIMYYVSLSPATYAPEEFEGSKFALKVHPSRVIRFDGDYLDRQSYETNLYWNASVLESIKEVADYFNTSVSALATVAYKASSLYLGMPDLDQVITQGEEGQTRDNLTRHLEQLTLKSGVGSVTVVPNDAKPTMVDYNIEGVAKGVEILQSILCSQTGYPITKLFGTSPSGMQATGYNDQRNYYDTVSSNREKMRSDIYRLNQVLYASIFDKRPPSDFDFDFPVLWKLDDNEKAQITLTTTQSITQAYQDGILPADKALKELSILSEKTGVFTSITEQDIDNAQEMSPPNAEEFINSYKSTIENKDTEKKQSFNEESPRDIVGDK